PLAASGRFLESALLYGCVGNRQAFRGASFQLAIGLPCLGRIIHWQAGRLPHKETAWLREGNAGERFIADGCVKFLVTPACHRLFEINMPTKRFPSATTL